MMLPEIAPPNTMNKRLNIPYETCSIEDNLQTKFLVEKNS